MKANLLAGALALTAVTAFAAPVTYKVNEGHTYPSFEADHMAGLSILRGKFNKSSGTITLDKDAKTGSVDITVDANSLDFGNDLLNEHARTRPGLFEVEKYPTITYTGKITRWEGGAPKEVSGDLTLHGVTKPVTLTINQFLCKPSPMTKKEVCGADASASIDRAEFGVDYATTPPFNFKPQVKLLIEVEADAAS
jgi:polyisoprenoid-binding protein YceI